MPYTSSPLGSRRGVVVVVTVLMLTVIIGFAALAIDSGVMFLAKTELQRTADAAALAAITKIDFKASEEEVNNAVWLEASYYAALNPVLGEHLELDRVSDVEIGVYDPRSGTFYADQRPVNAVRVTARRTESSPTGPIVLFLAGVFGHTTADVYAQSTVMLQVNCYTRGIRASVVDIDANTVFSNTCIYGRNRVQVDADVVALTPTFIASRDTSNILWDGPIPDGFIIKSGNMQPEAAQNVAAIIDGIENGSLVEPGTSVVVLDDPESLNFHTLAANTAYVINGTVKFEGDVVIEGITLAVRGDVIFDRNTVLRNGAVPGDGAAALAVLATGNIEFDVRSGVYQAILIAGKDVYIDVETTIFNGAIEAAGVVRLDTAVSALDEGYAMPYGSVASDPVMVR